MAVKSKNAFTYKWRLWTLPEVQEILKEAGFKTAEVYWEGTDDEGEGNGKFNVVEHGECDPCWVSYVVASK